MLHFYVCKSVEMCLKINKKKSKGELVVSRECVIVISSSVISEGLKSRARGGQGD